MSERQLREMRASTEYDKDWLEKIHRGTLFLLDDLLIDATILTVLSYCVWIAREKCWHACLYSFFLSVVASLVVETYWNVPEHTSAMSFLAYILVRIVTRGRLHIYMLYPCISIEVFFLTLGM